jgi:hypothetical protein
MWRATLKSLLAKKVRLALTALSVVLGVGFMAGTYVLTDTMSAAFDELFKTAAANTDVVVRAEAAFDPITGGPGGNSTIFKLAPCRAAIAVRSSRIRSPRAWLCIRRLFLPTRSSRMSATFAPRRR